MRKAVDGLLKHALTHDIAETAAMTGIGSLIHAANGMEGEDVAQAAAIGFGTGMASRPLMRHGGAAVGRMMDKHMPMDMADKPNWYNLGMAYGVPGSRQSVLANEHYINSSNPLVSNLSAAALPINKMRRDAFMVDGKGNPLGDWEGDMSVIGRMFGDNVAQAAMYLVGPALVGG